MYDFEALTLWLVQGIISLFFIGQNCKASNQETAGDPSKGNAIGRCQRRR